MMVYIHNYDFENNNRIISRINSLPDTRNWLQKYLDMARRYTLEEICLISDSLRNITHANLLLSTIFYLSASQDEYEMTENFAPNGRAILRRKVGARFFFFLTWKKKYILDTCQEDYDYIYGDIHPKCKIAKVSIHDTMAIENLLEAGFEIMDQVEPIPMETTLGSIPDFYHIMVRK
jgi:hypothetical protein